MLEPIRTTKTEIFISIGRNHYIQDTVTHHLIKHCMAKTLMRKVPNGFRLGSLDEEFIPLDSDDDDLDEHGNYVRGFSYSQSKTNKDVQRNIELKVPGHKPLSDTEKAKQTRISEPKAKACILALNMNQHPSNDYNNS
jgi:hypothetical protein